jgi:hypothetical protein
MSARVTDNARLRDALEGGISALPAGITPQVQFDDAAADAILKYNDGYMVSDLEYARNSADSTKITIKGTITLTNENYIFAGGKKTEAFSVEMLFPVGGAAGNT